MKLQEELQWNAEEGAEHQPAPLTPIEPRRVCEQHGRQAKHREREAVKDHGADVHFVERDLAEEEAAAPKDTGQRAGCKAQRLASVLLVRRHPSYQTRQLLAGTMGEPTLQPNAEAKPGWFTIGPSTRK